MWKNSTLLNAPVEIWGTKGRIDFNRASNFSWGVYDWFGADGWEGGRLYTIWKRRTKNET